jgi:hypothetical protein
MCDRRLRLKTFDAFGIQHSNMQNKQIKENKHQRKCNFLIIRNDRNKNFMLKINKFVIYVYRVSFGPIWHNSHVGSNPTASIPETIQQNL